MTISKELPDERLKGCDEQRSLFKQINLFGPIGTDVRHLLRLSTAPIRP
jgi:hypothetical protein